MKLFTNIIKPEIVRIIKRIYIKESDYFVTAKTHMPYPIFLTSLLSRINYLQSQFEINQRVYLFDLKIEVNIAKEILRNKGGVYVL